MPEFVINPLSKEELSSFIDDRGKEIIRYFLIKSLFSQPEPKIGQSQLPIQIPKEHIEQWFTQALDVSPTGAGSYPIDIYNDRERWGADIKMLSIDVIADGSILPGNSGEASLGQKFKGPGINLDSLFTNGNFEEIKNEWLALYESKFETVKERYPEIEEIYYFFILRPGIQDVNTNFYIAGARINLERLSEVTIDSGRTTVNSVYLNNFIANIYGNTKIYKAKKRLELRLNAKQWDDDDLIIKIKTSFAPRSINLRNLAVNTEFIREEIERALELEIDFSD